MKGVIFLVFFSNFFEFAISVGVGRVVIGKTPEQLAAEGLARNPTTYTVSKNAATGSIPIYLEVLPDGTAFDSAVDVFCETVPSPIPLGYSEVRFPTTALRLTAQTGTISGTVVFTVVNPGRPIQVQCYGVSVGTDQFTVDLSTSGQVSLQVTTSASVAFCTDTVTVPNILGVSSGSFVLTFSEPIDSNNATVSCSVATNTVPGGFLNINMGNSRQVFVGQLQVTMTYTILSATGNDVIVSCSAQSQNGGDQFVTGTSSDRATFTEDAAKISFYPSQMSIKSTIFETILRLDAPLPDNAQDVNFACTANLINDEISQKRLLESYICVENVDNVNIGINLTTTVPFLETEWVIFNANPVFKPGEIMKQLRVERNLQPDSELIEYILLVCCVPGTNNQSPKYSNEIISSVIEATMTPALAVDFTVSTDALFISETVTLNPAFVPLSPCPCDLHPDVCDTGCCCDANCTANDKLLFDCLPGIYGGEKQDGYKDESCLANPHPKPNWHKLMCVVFEQNPLLGSAYQTTPVIKTNNQFVSKELEIGTINSFAETETRTLQERVNTTLGYTQGISIKTQGDGIRGILSLPGLAFDGRCERNLPVRYLTDTSSRCIQRMSEAVCKSVGSIFNAQNYVQNPENKSPPCPDPLHIPSRPGVGSPSVPVSANYFCTNILIGYIIDRQPSAPVASSFAGVDKVLLENCTFNDIGVLDCFSSTVTPVQNPARCSFDDGETRPPAPVWDQANSICRNAVLDVQYKFSWSGTSLESVTANYILGDVPADTSYAENVVTTETVIDPITGNKEVSTSTNAVTTSYPSDVNQRFNVEFIHSKPLTNVADPNVLTELSGNPGYNPYYPIIGSVLQSDGKYNADKQYWPRYFVPNSETLDCVDVSRDFVKFDQAVSGTCLMYLNLDDFSDCDLLRKFIHSTLDSLMPAEYLSMVGNPNMSEPSHWLKIDRQNISTLINALNSTPSLGESTSRCENVPIGISLDIMFADSGTLADKYIQRLVNAKIKYQLSTLELKCGGSFAKDCADNAQSVQAFGLYSAAQYIFVRSDLYKLSRWEHFHYQCVQEFCKEEAMFPFTRYYQGGTYEDSLLWMIGIVCVTLFIFVITRPWW